MCGRHKSKSSHSVELSTPKRTSTVACKPCMSDTRKHACSRLQLSVTNKSCQAMCHWMLDGRGCLHSVSRCAGQDPPLPFHPHSIPKVPDVIHLHSLTAQERASNLPQHPPTRVHLALQALYSPCPPCPDAIRLWLATRPLGSSTAVLDPPQLHSCTLDQRSVEVFLSVSCPYLSYKCFVPDFSRQRKTQKTSMNHFSNNLNFSQQ